MYTRQTRSNQMKIKGVGYIEPSGLNLQPRNR